MEEGIRSFRFILIKWEEEIKSMNINKRFKRFFKFISQNQNIR